jgi:hypothetical protein
MSSVVNTIMRVAIIILVVGISVLLSKYFMAISTTTTTTTKKNRIYNLNDCRICLHKITTINHEIIGHMDKGFKGLVSRWYIA